MRKVIKLTTVSSEAINIGLLFLAFVSWNPFLLNTSYKISSLRYIQLKLIRFINEIDVQLLFRLHSQLNGVALLENCFANYCHFDSILILYSIGNLAYFHWTIAKRGEGKNTRKPMQTKTIRKYEYFNVNYIWNIHLRAIWLRFNKHHHKWNWTIATDWMIWEENRYVCLCHKTILLYL